MLYFLNCRAEPYLSYLNYLALHNFRKITTRANRTHFPGNWKQNKPEVTALHHVESIFRQKGNIVLTVWKDKKAVSFISRQSFLRGDEMVHRKQDGTSLQNSPIYFYFMAILMLSHIFLSYLFSASCILFSF